MLCEVCGMRDKGKCLECIKDIAPDCMIKNQDLIANETWEKLHDSPYWGINGRDRKTRLPNTGEKLAFGSLEYYRDTNILFFSGAFIPTANILMFRYDYYPQKDGSTKITATIKTRYPDLTLTTYIDNRIESSQKDAIERCVQSDILLFKDKEVRREYLDFIYMKPKKNTQKKEVKQLSYQEAKAIYMFDDSYTLDELKKQKRRLIKVFHPDNADGDKAYAQKIVEAYEVLLKKIS